MAEPARILYTIPNFITAGSGQALVNIIQRLDRSRFSPTVCVSRRGGRLEAVLESLGVPVLEHAANISVQPYASILTRARAASHPFRQYHFDLWHSFHYSDDYSEPLVARFSGAKAWVFTKKNMNWNRRSWWLRAFLAKHILAQNTDMLRMFFSSWMLHRKTSLVPRGVDLQRFRPLSPTSHLREQYGLPDGAPVVGMVAQLVPVKGHATAIQALAQLPGVHLVLAGGGLESEYAASLRELAQVCGLADRVHFAGSVTDIPLFLSAVDVFILPTLGRMRMEGCPVALLEAMACAKACIATDIPGSRDLIIEGESGLLVKTEDPAALAQAISNLLSDPDRCSRLGKAARERVETNFSIEREVDAHQALYAQILYR